MRGRALLAARGARRALPGGGADARAGQAGDRVKTDRRDAERLARSLRSGDLTPVWVPDAAHEALRDLVRAREAAKKDDLRARHRLQKFLLRHGGRPPAGIKAWTERYRRWLTALRFEHPAQEATRLDYLTEGRIVVEAAWTYRHRPRVGHALRRRHARQSETVKAIAWKVQHRLYSRYCRLQGRGKSKQQVVTAVARELLGFVWAIGVAVDGEQSPRLSSQVA